MSEASKTELLKGSFENSIKGIAKRFDDLTTKISEAFKEVERIRADIRLCVERKELTQGQANDLNSQLDNVEIEAKEQDY